MHFVELKGVRSESDENDETGAERQERRSYNHTIMQGRLAVQTETVRYDKLKHKWLSYVASLFYFEKSEEAPSSTIFLPYGRKPLDMALKARPEFSEWNVAPPIFLHAKDETNLSTPPPSSSAFRGSKPKLPSTSAALSLQALLMEKALASGGRPSADRYTLALNLLTALLKKMKYSPALAHKREAERFEKEVLDGLMVAYDLVPTGDVARKLFARTIAEWLRTCDEQSNRKRNDRAMLACPREPGDASDQEHVESCMRLAESELEGHCNKEQLLQCLISDLNAMLRVGAGRRSLNEFACGFVACALCSEPEPIKKRSLEPNL